MSRDPRQYCPWCPAHSDAPLEHHERHCPRHPRRDTNWVHWLAAVFFVFALWALAYGVRLLVGAPL